ncbi:MAG: hypothetical protein RLO01_00145 [Thalassobaculaceae bacterium]
MIDLTQFLGSTSTLLAPLQYSFNGTVQPDSSAIFLVREPQILILYGTFVLPVGGGIPISGSLTLSSASSGTTGTIVYTPTSGGGSMSQKVSLTVNGSALKLTPTDSSYHGSPSKELETFFRETLDAVTYFTLKPVDGAAGATNTQLFADIAGLEATTVLVPAS